MRICYLFFIFSGPVDVVLLLDSSDDFRSNYFEKEKEFAINFIEKTLNDEVRIGLYTFGRRTHVQFDLHLYSSIDQMRVAIDHMWYSTGNGKLEDAIDFTITNAFNDAAGDRECVSNVFLILTHKPITDHSLITSIEEKLNEKIIRTLIVNVGNSEDDAEYIQITGDRERVFDITSLDTLLSISTTLANKVKSGVYLLCYY